MKNNKKDDIVFLHFHLNLKNHKNNNEVLMEDTRVKIIATLSVISLIVIIIAARVMLKLSRAFFLIFGAGITVMLAVFVCATLSLSYNRRRRRLESRMKSEGRELRIEYSFLRKVAGVPTKFKFIELEEATDGFNSLIGKGASASVFKGILSDGTPVAVKRIDSEERGEKEFKSEVAAIASVHHKNLVKLIGYCNASSAPRYLVYDYVPNGSLDCWIFHKKESSKRRRIGGCLQWNLRYRVAIDVARGISYLHHDCRSRILHLDIKPENILLDENFRALVSDFGLSKLIGKDENYAVSRIRGTRGYLAPEWLLEQSISEKTDIYSYGMVLLEIIGGRKNVTVVEDERGNSRGKLEYFPKIVNEKMREGKLMEIIDHRLMEENGGIDEKEVKRMVDIALWCVQEKPRLRPSMEEVVEMLEGRVRVEEPPFDTKMVIVDLLCLDEDSTRGSGSDDNNNNNIIIGSTRGSDSSSYSFATTVLSGR